MMLMESLFRCKCNEVGYVELAFQKKTVLKKYLLLKSSSSEKVDLLASKKYMFRIVILIPKK